MDNLSDRILTASPLLNSYSTSTAAQASYLPTLSYFSSTPVRTRPHVTSDKAHFKGRTWLFAWIENRERKAATPAGRRDTAPRGHSEIEALAHPPFRRETPPVAVSRVTDNTE